MSTIFLGINFILPAAHFCNIFAFIKIYIMSYSNILLNDFSQIFEFTVLFTAHSAPPVQRTPRPSDQPSPGPQPGRLSYPFCGMLVHKRSPVSQGTQLYCSECTPEQVKPCKQSNTKIFCHSSLSSVNQTITCSVRAFFDLGSTKVNILKKKRL